MTSPDEHARPTEPNDAARTDPRTDPRTDEQLIAAANTGSHEAFAAFYERHRSWVATLAQRFCGRPDEALDVLQETFLYVLRKLPHLQLTCAARSFLYPVVKHLAQQHWRRTARGASRPALPASSTTSDDDDADGNLLAHWPAPPAPGDPRSELATALQNLPAIHREVVMLRFADDLSLEEIAQALGIPLGTVKSRLHHALETLRADPGCRDSLAP